MTDPVWLHQQRGLLVDANATDQRQTCHEGDEATSPVTAHEMRVGDDPLEDGECSRPCPSINRAS